MESNLTGRHFQTFGWRAGSSIAVAAAQIAGLRDVYAESLASHAAQPARNVKETVLTKHKAKAIKNVTFYIERMYIQILLT